MAEEAAFEQEQEQEEALDYTEGLEGEEAVVTAEEADAAPVQEDPAEEEPTDGAENGTAENGTEEPLSADDPTAQPPHGTEVFVGGVPRTATEEQLSVFAAEVGEVHGITLLREPQNPEHNRGFGFIKYKTRDAANAALQTLGGKQMADFPGQSLRVAPSQSKHKLYVGNIPKELTTDTLKQELSSAVKGVDAVELLMSKDFPGQNRGFAFVEFYNHACAQAAKNALSAPTYTMGGRTLNVAYAEPKQHEQQQAQQQPQAQPKVIYVGNLPNSANETNIKELFDTFSGGEVTKVVIPPAKPDKPNREFGFIHFAAKETVDKLIADAGQGTKPEMDGKTLEIKAAKPQVFPDQQQGFGGGRGGGFGGGRGGPRGRGGFVPRGRGRGGFGGRGGYNDYNNQGGGYGGYDEWGGGGGYGGYEEGYGQDAYMGYGGGYEDYNGGGYDSSYGGVAGASGMAMVPMMLPNGQVGYVLQGGGAGAAAGGYGGGPTPGGPMRSGGRGGGYSGRSSGGPRGRGRGGSGGRRFQPY
ncbi:g3002 [Coccomyxa viridis]|uniref:G3002 protein n=1 Tax=Coccomyxa viridis TaxID=1274662 RepID=A0ABP1FTP4_9CHLO